MAVLVAGTLLFATFAPWRSVIGVDNRTYVEMVAGVRDHGLPYTTNDFSDRFPEARARFNVARDGKLWGVYAPVFAYAAAPALAAGGLLGIGKANIVCMALLAIAVYLLGKRISDEPLAGVGAAYTTLLSTPIWASSFETLALPLFCLFLVIACYFAVRAVESKERSFGWAGLAGVFAGLAAGSHMHGFPMGILLIGGIALVHVHEPERPGELRALLPDLVGLARAACATLGMVLALVPVGLINRYRFGTPNPMSYGPCTWAQCERMGQSSLNAGALLSFALPAVPWMAIIAVALVLARKRWWTMAIVVALAAGSLAVPGLFFHDAAFGLVRTVYGYVVDVSNITFPEHPKPPDGLGHLFGGQVIKSMVQCSPVLLTGLLLPPIARSGPRARALSVWLAVVGQLLGLSLLGRFSGAWTFGWPYLFLRYIIPATPLLSVLSVVVLAKLPWRWSHVVCGAFLAAVGLVYFVVSTGEDGGHLRRWLELRGTLVLGVGVAILVFAFQRWPHAWVARIAPLVSAAAIGVGVAVSIGVDTRVLVRQIAAIDAHVGRIAAFVPQRFALAGWGPDTDTVLGMRAERDIQYIDLVEAEEGAWDDFREIIELWSDEGLPIYAVFPHMTPRFRWPYAPFDIPAELISDEDELWKIGPPNRRLSQAEHEAFAVAREERRKRAALPH